LAKLKFISKKSSYIVRNQRCACLPPRNSVLVKSSKEQLVNLQEIFHKVEIFIVTVYITEMTRIAFEVLSHEHASFFTALSIPFALLIAIIVSRLLHKE
jgi:hypothetical protein